MIELAPITQHYLMGYMAYWVNKLSKDCMLLYMLLEKVGVKMLDFLRYLSFTITGRLFDAIIASQNEHTTLNVSYDIAVEK